MTGRNILKGWFATAKKPTTGQFAEWIDSYWHKSEDSITVADVSGLSDLIGGKASAASVTAIAGSYLPLTAGSTKHLTDNVYISKSNNALYTEYRDPGQQVAITVGKVGNPEANLTFNMHYDFNSSLVGGGHHQYGYDNTSAAQWLAFSDIGGGMQYAPANLDVTKDIWIQSGAKYLFQWDASGKFKINSDFSNSTLGDAQFQIKRGVSNAHISGITDFFIEGNRQSGIAGDVNINALSSGDVILTNGVGTVRTGHIISTVTDGAGLTLENSLGGALKYSRAGVLSVLQQDDGDALRTYLGADITLAMTVSSTGLDIIGGGSFTGHVTAESFLLSTAPTTSVDTYNFLTWNTTTGVIEKVNLFGTANTFTAKQTFTGGVDVSGSSLKIISANIAFSAGGAIIGQITAPIGGFSVNRSVFLPDETGVITVLGTSSAPASSTSSGKAGTLVISGGFIYICTATNTWVRTAVTSF